MPDLQADLDAAIDRVLDCLEAAQTAGVELDPLATILARVKARGQDVDLSSAPPLMQMLLAGVLDG